MNKKGIGLILIIPLVLLALLFIGGIFSAIKLNNIITTIPKVAWYFIIGILIFIIISKSKK